MAQIRINNSRVKLIVALVGIFIVNGISYRLVSHGSILPLGSRDVMLTEKITTDDMAAEFKIDDVLPTSRTAKTQQKKKKIYRSKLEIQNIEEIYESPDPDFEHLFESLAQYVHLDLKGAPPNVKYFEQLFPFLKRIGATGLLMEYEDMFPYEGKCKDFSAKNSYTSEDLTHILILAKSNDLEVIPLVQTFGHMEFVLKYREYAHLREDDTTPQVITPTQNESYHLITSMLEQVISRHPTSSFIHIGCDEVYNLGKGKSQSILEKDKISVDELFLRHVKKVAEYVIKHHKLKPIIWDDMLRKMDPDALKRSQIGQFVEPMVWNYIRDPRLSLPKGMWENYEKVFSNIWIASSFKGATGISQYITDPVHHIQNHLSWVEIIRENKLLTSDKINFRGIALTGWQRYDHFAILCELFPVAIPSLVACIQTMTKGGFDAETYDTTNTLLHCEKPLVLQPPTDSRISITESCRFPGHELYYSVWEYHSLRRLHVYMQQGKGGYVSSHNMRNNFSSPHHLLGIKLRSMDIMGRLQKLEDVMWKTIPKYFDDFTAAEWIEVNIRQIIDQIKQDIPQYDKLMAAKDWPKRTLSSISKTGKTVISSSSGN